jgi:hypothetical protein
MRVIPTRVLALPTLFSLKIVSLFAVIIFVLTGCSSGLSASEKLTCDALFTSWKSTDLSESTNYLNLGVGELGDNSRTSEVLLENKQSAEYLEESLLADSKSDEDLKELVTDLRYAWSQAHENGQYLMWSLINSSRERQPALNTRQSEWSLQASLKMIEARTIGIKIRNKCQEIGYSGS